MPGVLEQVCSFAGPSWPHPDPCSETSQRRDHSCNPYLSSVSGVCGYRSGPEAARATPRCSAGCSPVAQPHDALTGPRSPRWQTILYPGETAHNGTAMLGKAFTTVDSQQHFLQYGANGAQTERELGCRELNFHWVGMYRCEISLDAFSAFLQASRNSQI